MKPRPVNSVTGNEIPSLATVGFVVMLPNAPREEAWKRLGTDLPLDKLDTTVSEAGLGDLSVLAPKILKGEIRGRVVVDVNK